MDLSNRLRTTRLGTSGPSKLAPFGTTVQRTAAQQCVDRAASQLVGSTAMIPTLTSRRCAPSPYPTRAPIRDSASSPDRRSLSSIFKHLPQLCVVHQQWRLPCVNGGMAPPDEQPLQGARKDTQTPVQPDFEPLPAPSRSLPSDHVCSIRAQRHLSARNRARQRLRRDRPRPGRRRGRHRRHRRLLFRLPRPLDRGEPHTLKVMCVRACGHERGCCAAGCCC